MTAVALESLSTSNDIDPILLSREIERRYQRYLLTRFHFKDRQLRESFERALRGGKLCKGPYLEATPVFEKAGRAEDIFGQLLGHPAESEFTEAVGGRRELYWHQAESVRRVHAGHNVVIATGTGSGKTEAFLLPILLHLYEEHCRGELGPGVRALVLYPMNALANDQRDRLGELCKALEEAGSSFTFTFGQYTGDTPEDSDDSRRRAQQRLDERLAGELVLRREMREQPPHILLTNYAMLEYLLLRPLDSPLFDSGNARWWKFIVLDEAHQYRGAKGIEMGMLLRRLKERLRQGGRTGGFTCIATSATLAGSDDASREAVATFASELFSEPFHKEDIITGRSVSIPATGGHSLTPADYNALQECITGSGSDHREALLSAAERLGVRLDGQTELTHKLGTILSADERSASLRRAITGTPRALSQLAEDFFQDVPPAERPTAIAQLVSLLCRARDPLSGVPLLDARYHLFLRALEGAFVRLTPVPEVLLDRKDPEPGQGVLFEVALCHECGQHYFVTSRITADSGTLLEPVRDPGEAEFGVAYLFPLGEPDSVEAEEEEDESQKLASKWTYKLCAFCGAFAKTSLNCGHGQEIAVRVNQASSIEKPQDQSLRCDSCGYTGGGREPVRELIHGADGPHTVIATTLFQFLPPERRKVLAFADGRQEAAYFAWYLEESYRDVLHRHLLLKTISRVAGQAGPVSLETLHRSLVAEYPDYFKNKESDDLATVQHNAWLAVLREFLTEERRLSLEGVGLVRWSIDWPAIADVAKPLQEPPFELDEIEARAALFILLNTMRLDRAVELPEEAKIQWKALGLHGSQTAYLPASAREKHTRAWSGEKTARVDYLVRVAGDCSEKAIEAAVHTLREVWQAILDSERRMSSRHGAHLLCGAHGSQRRLNPHWWRVEAVPDDGPVYRCDTCGRLQLVNVRDVCVRKGCKGRLVGIPSSELDAHHYRTLYRETLPGNIRVEEHTAQIEHDKAREYQIAFKDGQIHLLSCSTTFELGVDLGDLDVVFLRNVPPESFNYTQRVGRAGRRSGRAGFAVTYCTRNSHDLYYFTQPERMMQGEIQPPTLTMTNEKIALRHVTAVVLSEFFRHDPSRFNSVKELLGDMTEPCAAQDVLEFCLDNRPSLEALLANIVPQEIASKLGIPGGDWPERVAGGSAGLPEGESRLSLAEAEVHSDWCTLLNLEQKAVSIKKFRAAEWARRRQETLETEDVLSFLSRKAVIPKYGFPVDVVELDTRLHQQGTSQADQVQLQRDLRIAVSEFAPSAQVMANKRLWTSYGLKKVQEREWPAYDYVRCPKHNSFEKCIHQADTPALSKCCEHAVQGTLVVPLFGFTTDPDGPRPPSGRPLKLFTTRPYFVGFCDREGHELQVGPVVISPARPGEMVVVCEGRMGRGFYLCDHCGVASSERSPNHRDPSGERCPARNGWKVALGHAFVTDIVRLRFPGLTQTLDSRLDFAWSLAYALVEGAVSSLDVSSADLHCSVGRLNEEDCIPEVFIYDDVPGGAGLVGRLQNEAAFRRCLQEAHIRVSGLCGCGADESCYGCLRSYRNRFAHPRLKRGPVQEYLQALLDRL